MKYGDLRDYHNESFIIRRLEEILIIYGFDVLLYLSTIILKNPFYCLALFFDTAIYNRNLIKRNRIEVCHELNLINKNDTLKLREQIYHEILEKIKFRFKDKVITDPVKTNKYIYHIIRSGYLSKDKQLNIKNVSDKDNNFAYSILRGFGVCRNITYLTTDIFRILGFEAYDLILYDYFKKDEMHAITMVLHNEKLYFFDNLNLVNYTKGAYVLRDTKNSVFYMPVFYLESSDMRYKVLSYVTKERAPFDKVRNVYETYEQQKCENYIPLSYPKELKKIYTDNKKNYRKFLDTYYWQN